MHIIRILEKNSDHPDSSVRSRSFKCTTHFGPPTRFGANPLPRNPGAYRDIDCNSIGPKIFEYTDTVGWVLFTSIQSPSPVRPPHTFKRARQRFLRSRTQRSTQFYECVRSGSGECIGFMARPESSGKATGECVCIGRRHK